MKPEKIIETSVFIGNNTIRFESEVYDGNLCDTHVFVNSESLVWISGSEKEDFIQEFRNLIDKYSI